MSARIDGDLRAALTLEAAGERRTVSNMLEWILRERYSALTERDGSGQNGAAASPSSHPVAAGPDVQASRSVSAGPPAKVGGVVTKGRPHMKNHRPSVECPCRVFVDGRCQECGY